VVAPGVGYHANRAHDRDEHVRIEDFRRAAKRLTRLVVRFAPKAVAMAVVAANHIRAYGALRGGATRASHAPCRRWPAVLLVWIYFSATIGDLRAGVVTPEWVTPQGW
jgi:hypothetical protein